MSRDHTHFHLFDGLRALAATSVFGLHVWFIMGFGDLGHAIAVVGIQGLQGLADVMLNLGYLGVALFYVISAFLLYRPFYRARVHGHARPNLKSYFIRRAVRILPAYWVALTIIGLADGHSELFTLHGFIGWYCLTFIYSDGSFILNQILPAWTICVEASFYVFLPVWSLLAARVASKSKNPFRVELVLLAVLAAASVVWKLVVLHNLVGPDTAKRGMVVLPASLDVFAAGMALAVVSVRYEEQIRTGQVSAALRSGALWWVSALIGYGAMCALVDPRSLFGDDSHAHILLISLMKIPICIAIAMPAVFGPGSSERRAGPVRELLGSKPVQWVGKVSYGLYLWHIFVIMHLKRGGPIGITPLFPNAAIEWLPLIAVIAYQLTLAIAALSWRLVERPAMHRGRRLARRVEQESPAAAAAA